MNTFKLLRTHFFFPQIYHQCGLNVSTGVQHKWKMELSESLESFDMYVEAPFFFFTVFLLVLLGRVYFVGIMSSDSDGAVEKGTIVMWKATIDGVSL